MDIEEGNASVFFLCVCVFLRACVLCVCVCSCVSVCGVSYRVGFSCQASPFTALPRSYEKSVDNTGVKSCLV